MTAEGTVIEPDDRLTGTVVAVQANYYWVQLDRSPQIPADFDGRRLLCLRRARLKKMGQQVAVGDRVVVAEPDWQGQRGAIEAVLPRRSWLDRPPVANVDRVLLVFALAEPTLDPHQLGRFLAKAESTGLAITLCLNKQDLLPEADRQHWCDRLQAWGYDPLLLSVREGQGLEELRQILSDRIAVVAGPSGVGKSSAIGLLVGEDLRVGAVSGKLARGRHTTRHVELFELPGGGLLADTPGFNQPLLTCGAAAVAELFPEIRQRLAIDTCHYGDCLHREEPGCVVRGDWERYALYLELLEEVIAYEATREHQRPTDAGFKRKTRRDGREVLEPRLDSKRFRRTSRRLQHQAIEDPDE
ncbi:MAG: small ribosomal subunit biogenesis GTPase RsgA [Oscillatoriales cyanobacterium]|nr:MAG: small ribosomal subunit biogenesis GTPase RsgA [Oscillatoriales cyanobacterium]